jgi:hypothetical protein
MLLWSVAVWPAGLFLDASIPAAAAHSLSGCEVLRRSCSCEGNQVLQYAAVRSTSFGLWLIVRSFYRMCNAVCCIIVCHRCKQGFGDECYRAWIAGVVLLLLAAGCLATLGHFASIGT